MSNVFDFSTGNPIENTGPQYRMMGVDPVIDFIIQQRHQIAEIVVMVNMTDGQARTITNPMTPDTLKIFAFDLMATAMDEIDDE